jgi:hypothetical protein
VHHVCKTAYSAEVNNEWSYTSTLVMRLHGVVHKRQAETLGIFNFSLSRTVLMPVQFLIQRGLRR